MGREYHDGLLADLAEEVEEAHALGGVESCRGLVDDDERGAAEERDGDPEALAHAAGVSAQPLAANVPEIGLPQQPVDDAAAFGSVGEAFEHREVVEQPLGAHARVHAELLRQVAEGAAHAVLFAHYVDGLPRG